eukprot:13980265-Alexandrium_andersonii.AAC.1
MAGQSVPLHMVPRVRPRMARSSMNFRMLPKRPALSRRTKPAALKLPRKCGPGSRNSIASRGPDIT